MTMTYGNQPTPIPGSDPHALEYRLCIFSVRLHSIPEIKGKEVRDEK